MSRLTIPWVEALVFLSDPAIECRLEGNARAGVFLLWRRRRTADSQRSHLTQMTP
jgi:hypothetical protein